MYLKAALLEFSIIFHLFFLKEFDEKCFEFILISSEAQERTNVIIVGSKEKESQFALH